MNDFFGLFSYAFLFCICLKYISKYFFETAQPRRYFYGTILSIALYAIMGVLKLCKVSRGNPENTLNDIKFVIIPLFTLPCFASEVWLRNQTETATVIWTHFLFVVTLIAITYFGRLTKDCIDVITGINVLYLFGYSVSNQDYLATLCTLLFIMAHYGTQDSSTLNYCIGDEDLYTYSLAAFVYFTFLYTQLEICDND